MKTHKFVHLLSAASLTVSTIGATPAFAQNTPAPPLAPAATIAIPANLACSAAVVTTMVGRDVTIKSADSDATTGLCRVQGSIVTSGEGAPEGSARFELNLPSNWNRKLLFLGGGGFDGSVPKAPADRLAAGYATLATDSGHLQDPSYPSEGTDATWVVNSDGSPATAKIADYAYRARHQVHVKLRPAIAAFYQADVERAYFIGCSGGGREALIEAQRNPDMFDGFIAGDPATRAGTPLSGTRNFRALLEAPIPFGKFAGIDRAVMEDCDVKDGVKDGLIQNPALCNFNPKTLVRSGVLSAEQAKALTTYLSVARDSAGREVGFGGSVSGMGDLSAAFPGMTGGLSGLSAYLPDNMAPNEATWPWGELPAGPINWLLYNGAVSSLGLGQPGRSILAPATISTDGVLSASVVDQVTATFQAAAVEPAKMKAFFASNAKLIIYHGFEDTILDPWSTIATYHEITKTAGGIDKARPKARLFMAPGMGHCFAGSGPNVFDPLPALENWVEHGQAPDAIIAYKFRGNIPSPDTPIERSMPLCSFPEMARYDGKGDVNAATSWSCGSGDKGLTKSGPNGVAAGVAPILAAFR